MPRKLLCLLLWLSLTAGAFAVTGANGMYAALDGDAAYSCRINDDRVRMRASPYLVQDNIIGVMSKDERLGIIRRLNTEKELIAGVEAYWYKVCLPDGRTGWMFGAYIEGVDERYELINKDIDRFIQKEGGRTNKYYHVLDLYQESSLEKLKDLPLELRHRITSLYIYGSGIASIPDLTCLPFLGEFSAMNIQSLRSIEGLRNTSVMSVAIRGTSVTDISVLSTCKNLTNVYAENTEITTLPDFSDLSKSYEEKRVEHVPGFTWLKLYFDNSELNNIETVKTIGKNFLLSVRGCNRLNNLDALIESNIEDLIIDEQNYQRLKPWFDKNLPLIKARKADFVFGFVEYE